MNYEDRIPSCIYTIKCITCLSVCLNRGLWLFLFSLIRCVETNRRKNKGLLISTLVYLICLQARSTLFTGWCWWKVQLCQDGPVTIDLIVTMSLILPCVITWNPFRLPQVSLCNAMNHLSNRIPRTNTKYIHINSIRWSWIPLNYQYMHCITYCFPWHSKWSEI